MDKVPDQSKALEMINSTLRHMKNELSNIDSFLKKNNLNPKKIHIEMSKIDHMHHIYEEIENLCKKYEKSNDVADLNLVCIKLEEMEPGFELNYGEFITNAQAQGYSFP